MLRKFVIQLLDKWSQSLKSLRFGLRVTGSHPSTASTAFLIDLVKPDSNKNDSLCRNLIAQILFASDFDFFLELRAFDLRVEFVERIQRRLDVNFVDFVEEILNAIVLSVMNLENWMLETVWGGIGIDLPSQSESGLQLRRRIRKTD